MEIDGLLILRLFIDSACLSKSLSIPIKALNRLMNENEQQKLLVFCLEQKQNQKIPKIYIK